MGGKIRSQIWTAAIVGILMWNAGAAQSQTDSDRAQYKLGQQYEAIGDFDQALKIYLFLINKNPKNFTYFDAARKCYVSLKRYDELIQLIELRIEREPHNFQYPIRLGETYLQKEDKEKAFSIWDQLLVKHKNNSSVYRMVANVLIRNRLYDDSIDIYKKGRETLEKPQLFALELAQLHAYRFNYDKATDEYLRYLSTNQGQLSYVQARLASYKGTNETYEQVTSSLERWISNEPGNPAYRKLLISFLLSFENYTDAFSAVKKLEQILDQTNSKNNPGIELFKFSQIAMTENQYELAEKALNRILSEYPKYSDKARIEYELARTYYLQERFDRALNAFNNVARKYPKSIWTVESILTRGDIFLDELFIPDSAVYNFKRVLDDYGKNQNRMHTLIRLGDVEVSRGNLQEAASFYLQAIKTPTKGGSVKNKNVNQFEGQLKLAELAFFQRDFKKTRKNIADILQLRAGSMSNSYVNDALEISILLDNNEQTAPEALGLYAEGILLKKQHRLAESTQKFQTVAESYSKSNVAPRAQFQYSELKRKTGDFLSAVLGYQALISQYPENSLCDLALWEIGVIYQNDLKDVAKAIESYESILVNYPQSMLVEQVRKRIRSLEGKP